MSGLEALVLGLLQGFTEYLPVSSSGHLAIGSALFGIEGEESLACGDRLEYFAGFRKRNWMDFEGLVQV